MSLAYDEYLNEHIGAVQKGWNWMLDNLIDRIHPWIREQYPNSEFDPIDVFEISDQMQYHDASKIRPEEYYAYDAYFYGGNKSHAVVENFQCIEGGLGQTRTSLYQIERGNIAVFLADDNILGHVYQTTSQVTGVSRTQCGIGQTLTGTMGRNKVIGYGQAFTEVCRDRQVDDFTRRVSH